MKSPIDPIRSLRRRSRVVIVTGAVLLMCALGWALRPLPPYTLESAVTSETHSTPGGDPERSAVSFDRHAFERVQLWHVDADPTSGDRPEAPATTPQITTLALIGVVESDGVPRQAAIYDTKASELQLVGVDEQISGFTITEIRRDRVTLVNGTREYALTMEPAVRESTGDLAAILEEVQR